MNPRIGVILPSLAVQRDERLSLAEAARLAERLGLDGVWHGDHLATGNPSLDSTVALATAAAVTERVSVGLSVFIPAIRPLAWAAKQIASLQRLSGDRLLLGVGSGGGPAQWAAAGVPYAERGRRTDLALRLLPELLAGKATRFEHEPGAPVVELLPTATMPPVWVGNASAVAIRRAAELGDGWFPSLIPPAELSAGRARLVERAAELGRPEPVVALGATGALGSAPGLPTVEDIAAGMHRGYGIDLERARAIPITGPATAVAERFADYAEAGASHVVIGLTGPGWRAQAEVLAEARSLLQPRE
ncbi:LLM class flavin-dependent oxidoreductase [Amycolatopsis nigrescens]|uniref:LLM class flavin-dependent oxidoreductase n=1 Tax=Amycolatopsis nigrescens TaxID=381445 RepID=UPI00037831DE|nr:LLM class flavin-dependent oxidoreductase [Amycolatopsis nigrescens]